MKSIFKSLGVIALAVVMCLGTVACKNNLISATTGRLLLHVAVSVAYNEAVNNGIQIGEQRLDLLLDRIARIKSVISAVETEESLPDIGIGPIPFLTVDVFTDKRAAKRFAVDAGIAIAYQYAVERGAEMPKEKLQRTYRMLCELEAAILFATGRTDGGIAILSEDASNSFDLVLTD